MIVVYALLAVIFAGVWTAVVIVTGVSGLKAMLAVLVIYAIAALLLGLAAGGVDITTRAGRSR